MFKNSKLIRRNGCVSTAVYRNVNGGGLWVSVGTDSEAYFFCKMCRDTFIIKKRKQNISVFFRRILKAPPFFIDTALQPSYYNINPSVTPREEKRRLKKKTPPPPPPYLHSF